MKMKFTFEFVFLKENKIDPKLKKFQEYLIRVSPIKRNLFVVEKDFDPSRTIDEVVASVMNDNVTRFKNYIYIDGISGNTNDVVGAGVSDVGGVFGEGAEFFMVLVVMALVLVLIVLVVVLVLVVIMILEHHFLQLVRLFDIL